MRLCPACTIATSHVDTASTTAGAADDKAAANKKTKYAVLEQTHVFVPVAIKTWDRGTMTVWISFAASAKKPTDVTGNPLETSYPFQRLSVAIQRSNGISFAGTLPDSDC